MSCCCPHSQSAGRLFSLFARRYRKRFQRHGFERSQQQLIAGLAQVGYQDATLLEIGSGVGYLHQTLLERGAKTAVGIDLAPKMLMEARTWACERGLTARTQYLEGDFMEFAGRVSSADITLLDKVICCYPDANGLVHRSLDCTERVYALTYPRKRRMVQIGSWLTALFMWLIRSSFRVYVHDPKQVEAWITQAGFEKYFEQRTFIWLTQVYVRVV